MRVLHKLRTSLAFYLRHTDTPLLLLCLAASVYSCLLVYSVAVTAESGARVYLMQIAASSLGLILAVILSKIDYEDIVKLWPVWAGISLVLVLLTFTPLGVNVVGTDDTAWLSIFGVTIQPAELLKIAFIITFAKHLSVVKDHINRLTTVLLLCLHGGLAAGLIFLQGDDGTALVFLCIFVCMLFASGLRALYFLIAGAAGVCAVPLMFLLLDDQKLGRILALIHPDQYLESEGWQQALGLSAMGTGQLWGVGYLQGGDHMLFSRESDFIFTAAAEEFGFIGGLLLLVLLLGILLCILHDARHARDYTGTMLCTGMMGLIGFQTLINLGMVLRLLPVVGITLPFFSAGASSVGSLYLGIGLVLSVRYSSSTRNLSNSSTLRKFR